jgi:hypothetical protein
MSDVYRINTQDRGTVVPYAPASRDLDSGPSLNETLLEIGATLAGIGAVFVGIMTVVGLLG